MNAGNWSRMVARVLCATWTAAPVLANDGVWSAPEACEPQVRVDMSDCGFIVLLECDGNQSPRNATAHFSPTRGYYDFASLDFDSYDNTLHSDLTFISPREGGYITQVEPFDWQMAFSTGGTTSLTSGERQIGQVVSRIEMTVSLDDVTLFTSIGLVDVYSGFATAKIEQLPDVDSETGEPIEPSEVSELLNNSFEFYAVDIEPVLALETVPIAITAATANDPLDLNPLPQCLETE